MTTEPFVLTTTVVQYFSSFCCLLHAEGGGYLSFFQAVSFLQSLNGSIFRLCTCLIYCCQIYFITVRRQLQVKSFPVKQAPQSVPPISAWWLKLAALQLVIIYITPRQLSHVMSGLYPIRRMFAVSSNPRFNRTLAIVHFLILIMVLAISYLQ